MNRSGKNIIFVICSILVLAGAERGRIEAGEDLTVANHLQPFLQEFCHKCHNAERHKGDLNFETYWNNEALFENRKVWEKVAEYLREREMPPEGKPQPPEATRADMVGFIQTRLDEFDCDGLSHPGRVTIRRLNRNEYNHTIHDLVGVDFQPAADFPADEVGYGFDNIGDVLSLSSLQMERYLEAAVEITDKAILSELPQWPPVTRYQAESFASNNGDDIRPYRENLLGLYREGQGSTNITITATGDYRIRVRSYGAQAGPDKPKLELRMDGQPLKVFDVDAYSDDPAVYEFETRLENKDYELAVAYLNNYNVDGNDRNLFVDYVEIEGPLEVSPPPLPETHTRIIPRHPEPGHELEAAREILHDFGGRAYRRPITDDEIDRLLELVKMVLEDDGTFEESIQVAVQAILTSPNFLFRWELDPGNHAEASSVRSLDDYELASRLSYFLWNSMPDDELFAAARRHELSDTEGLLAQVRRMLEDPKSQRFITDFAGQWLQIRNLDRVTPDPDLFPEFDAELKEDMRKETELFFEALVHEDRSVLDLLDADFTYLNERLARYYGIDGVSGDEFQRVSLGPESTRGGILTQASILTITSNPTRTSPVIRGKWILEQILGTPPPPPPPNVPELVVDDKPGATHPASLREKLEEHRAKPECAACHAKMDPLGFALENFDAVGKWRDLDGKAPIDASGTLPTGESFNGPDELKSMLKNRESFVRTLTEKMLTYALGRGLEYYDRCAVDQILEHLKANDHKFSALIAGIVTSDPFRMKQMEGETL